MKSKDSLAREEVGGRLVPVRDDGDDGEAGVGLHVDSGDPGMSTLSTRESRFPGQLVLLLRPGMPPVPSNNSYSSPGPS